MTLGDLRTRRKEIERIAERHEAQRPCVRLGGAGATQQNVERVRKGIDAFNRRDFDTALELVSEDVAFERFLSRAESQTEWVRGRRELRAVWKSQVEAVDLRVEPEEFIAVGADKVIVPVRMIARGSGSEIRLQASIAWMWTFDEAGIATRVEVFESRDKALTAVGRGE